MDRIISPLLLASGIYNTKSNDLNLHLQSHPEYPSLRSITDTLDYFNINNVAVKVDKTSLSQLPKMFLAHLKGELHMDFALVHQLKNKIKLTWQDGNSIHVSIEEFKEKWNGTLLAVEKDERQSNSIIQKLSNSNILSILLVISVLLFFWICSSTIAAFFFSVLSLLGLIVSYLIQKESFGIGDSTIAKVCSSINNNSDGCDAVIKSDQSKIFGISLSDISVVYFYFLLIISLFEGVDNYLLYVISGLTLATVFYTLYVQLFELKTWCILCLAVSVILVSQFLMLHFLIDQIINNLSFITLGFISMVLVTASWKEIKTLWLNTIELPEVKAELLGFKKDGDFFFHALEKNAKIFSNKINEKYSIFFGSDQPTIELTAITNPTCGYCTEAFEAYDYLLTKFPGDTRVEFVFSVSTDLDNSSNIVTARIIELYENDKSEAYRAMQNWFKNKDVDEWLKIHGSPNSENVYPQHCILCHEEWCSINGFVYTPETILGSSIFPKSHYNIRDVEFFVEIMKESQNQ